MSEQNNTPQVEEVATAAANVQPEGTVEAPAANNKVVDSEQKPVEEVNKADEPASAAGEEVVQEKPAVDGLEERKEEVPEAEGGKKADAGSGEDNKAASEDETNVGDEKIADEQPAKEGAASEATNGDDHKDKKVEEQVAEETNGVCKRKAENGAEVVEDEKSPKKAKVVDDGDQKPVEETAA